MVARGGEPVEVVPISSRHLQDPASTSFIRSRDSEQSNRSTARAPRAGNRQPGLPKQDTDSDRANVEAVRSFLSLGRLTFGQGRSSGGVDKNGSSRVQRPFLEPSLLVESALRSQDPHYSLLPFSSARFPPTPGTREPAGKFLSRNTRKSPQDND
jgi:hypothetical protein